MKIETLFDLKIATFDSRAPVKEIIQAEKNDLVHVIKVVQPDKTQINELCQIGYFLKPTMVGYYLSIPQRQDGETVDVAFERYYEQFTSKSGKKRKNRFKKIISIIEDEIKHQNISIVENDENVIGEFLELYVREMDAKERGQKHLLTQIQNSGLSPFEFMKKTGRTGIYLRQGKDIVAGVIIQKLFNVYSISFLAIDSQFRKTYHNYNVGFFLLREVIKKSMEKGHSRLLHGVDTNLYGHHLSIGLMLAKKRYGFLPHPIRETELMKITQFSVFKFPIFFYNLNAERKLESTLIVRQDMLENRAASDGLLKLFKELTESLNLYIYDNGQLLCKSTNGFS